MMDRFGLNIKWVCSIHAVPVSNTIFIFIVLCIWAFVYNRVQKLARRIIGFILQLRIEITDTGCNELNTNLDGVTHHLWPTIRHLFKYFSTGSHYIHFTQFSVYLYSVFYIQVHFMTHVNNFRLCITNSTKNLFHLAA